MAKSGLITLSSTPRRPIGVINDDYFYRSLVALITASDAAQDSYRLRLPTMDRRYWVKEYCTVRVGGPRGCGKTESIFRYILDHNVSAYYFTNSRDCATSSRDRLYRMLGERGINTRGETMNRIDLNETTFINIDFANRTTLDSYRSAENAPFIFVDNCMWIENATERLFSVMQFAESMIRQEENFHFVMIG